MLASSRTPIVSRTAVPLVAVVAIAVIVSPPATVRAAFDGPITRAIRFLYSQQLQRPLDVVVNGARIVDFPGDWPQHFALEGADWFRVRDVSPFTVAFIHHALSSVNERSRAAIGASRSDLRLARTMRRRAIAFMQRFAAPDDAPDAGTYGFWPYDTDLNVPDPITAFLLTALFQGPMLGGQRVPINLPIFPSTLAIPSDADVTATTYAALLDHVRLDGGVRSTRAMERVFVDWRDVGAVPRRINPGWLPPSSGAFLTWLTYREQPFPIFPNDVDLVVNGNVLFALARHGRADVPGVSAAVSYINLVTALGLHRQGLEGISEYYPDNLAFQYVVSRAFREGPVPALEPAVQTFADDLEAGAVHRRDGIVYWDRGHPHLNTAFAVLTLLNAHRHSEVVDRAIAYLRREQSVGGGFGEAPFFFGRTDSGVVFEFSSPSFTTAMVLEAFVRDREAHHGTIGLVTE